MKRRLLSAFLALAMLFSLIPTTFAQQSYDSNGNITGSPNIVKNIAVKIESGELTQFDITFPDPDTSPVINENGRYFAVIATDYNDPDVGNDYTDVLTNDSDGVGYVMLDKNIPYDPDAGTSWGLFGPAAQWYGISSPGETVNLTWSNALNKSFNWTEGSNGFGSDFAINSGHTKYQSIADLEGCSVYVYVMLGDVVEGNKDFSDAFVANIGAFDAEGNLTFPATSGEDTAITAINATITAPAYGNTPDANATNISVTPAAGCTATSAALSWDGNPSSFAYDTDYTASFTLTPVSGYKFTSSTDVNISGATNTSVTVDAGTGVATVKATFHSPAQQIQTVGAITATVDAPALNTAPANALSGISGTGVDTSSVTNLAWSPNDLINGNFKAGQAYTVSFDVSPQSGYKFASGTTTATVNGNTATVNVTSDTSATVSYTFAAIDKKVTAISATGTLQSYKPNDPFALPNDINVVLTYNDGSTAGFSSANFASSGFSFVYGPTKSDLTIGQNLALSDNNQPVFVKYTGSDIDGGAASLTSTSIGSLSVTYDPINSVAVTIDEPAGGKTAPTNAAVVGTVNYSVDSTDVTWYEGTGTTGNQVGSTDKLQYGSTYTVSILVAADTNYLFANSLTSATINSETVSSTVDTSDNGTVTLTKTFTIGAAPAVTLQTTNGFDKYNNGNNVVLKTDANLTGVNASVTVNGTTKTGTYNPADGTITFAAADLLALGANLTSTGETWTASVLYDGITTAKTVGFTAKDTTPYITITDPSDGTITGIAHTSGTKVALTKNQAYTLTAAPTSTAHWTGTTWTVNGISGAESGTNNDTYKFTPTGSENITVSVAFTTAASYTLTVNATNGSVAVKRTSDGTEPSKSGNVYTIYSDETYTLTATADNQYKFTGWGDDLSGTTNPETIANPTANKTVTANFAAKTDPTISADMVYRKGANDTDKAFTITLGDYAGVNVSGTPAGTLSGTTYTVSASVLENATVGEHTYTFDFGEGKTLTGKIDVKAAMTVSKLTLPSSLKHGDTLDTISFDVTVDGTPTTYTYSGGSWNNTPDSAITFAVNGGGAMSVTDFVNDYMGSTVYVDRGSRTDVLQNGDSISVSAGGSTTPATLAVAKKDIVLDASTTDTNGFNKTYDGTATVTASPINWALASGYAWVDGDTVNPADIAISGKYRNDTDSADDANAKTTGVGKPIKFTATATTGTVADKNYNITVNNGNGKISPLQLTIESVTNIPSATKGLAAEGDVNSTAITNTNLNSSGNQIVSGDTVNISYHYKYDDTLTSTNVDITSITSLNTNYTITPNILNDQTGVVNDRVINKIEIVNAGNTYNYSDKLAASDIQVKITFADAPSTPVTYNIGDTLPTGVSLKWTQGTDSGNAVTTNQTLTVDGHSGKTITATDNNGHTDTTTITVNPLPVNVEATGTLSKTYDGTTTYTSSNGTITYTPTLDSSVSSYSSVFTTDAITASSTSVAFSGADAHDTAAASNITQTNITLSNPNYKVNSFTNSVTDTIDKAEVTVTAISNIPEIKQYTTGLTGTKTVQTNGSGDVTVTGIQHSETIEVEYGYSYPDSATSGPRNDVNITSCKLTSTYGANKNYTLNNTYPSTGSGSVKARTISAFTVTAPTQFTNSQSTAVLYGTQLDLTGLAVSISYGTSGADGTDVYTWTSSGWTLTQDGGNTESVSSVPFTWGWDGGSQPSQSDILTVANNGKGIKATSTDDPNKSHTSTAVKVDPITIDDITVSYTGDSITKTYDGDNTVDFPSTSYTLTYSSNDILSGDASSVTITATYVYPNVNYNASAYTLTPTWGLATANANYKFASNVSVTNPLTGTITQRPIKVTGVSKIEAINQYDDISNAKQVSSDTNATFSAVDGVTESGLIGSDKPEISYSYQYSKNTPAGTDNAVSVTGIAFVSGGDNYQLNNTTLTATGTINSVNASAITITGTPTQLGSSADVQYGDTLSLSGLAVKVGYGTGGTTHEDTYTYDGTNWKKGTDTVADGDLPFTLSWSGTSYSHGDTLNTVNTTGDKLTAALKDDSTKTADVGTLVVNKRKVTVTPKFKTGVSQLTKIYDGGTSYTNNGDIEFTVASVSSYTGTLPTVTGATYAYNYANASTNATDPATKVTVSAPVLSDTTNFVVDGYTATDLVATITKRGITLKDITNVPNVKQYDPDYATAKSGKATSASGATFEAADATTGIVNNEVVGLKYSYTYSGNNGTDITASVTGIDFDGTTAANNNYSLTATDKTVNVSVDTRAVTLTVTNPSMFGSTVTYGDKLNLNGMQVVVNYDGTPTDTYAATQSGDTVSWTKNGTSYTGTLPFSLAWTNSKGAIGTDTQNTKLTVYDHNGQSIVATHTASGVTGSGATVTISPKEITVVNAALKASTAIEKVYDGNTNVETADSSNIEYTSTDVSTGDTVVITATPSYTSKDVATTPNNITFGAPSLTNDFNGNYKLASNATVTGSITGTITAKAVTITGVYIPTTYKDTSATDDEAYSYTNARVASNTSAANSVTIDATNCFVSGEESDMTFAYTVTYKAADLATSGSPTVTLSGTNVTGTSLNPASNYNITWNPSLTGSVIDDKITNIQIDASNAKLTGYTHGDKLNLAGLKVTVTTDNTGTNTYTVTGSEDNYAWDAAIPDYISIGVNGISLKDNTALNGKAHYTKMNGNPITVSATGVTPQSTGNMGVAQKQLNASASATGTLEKVYDKSTALPTGTTIGYTIGTGEVQSFGDVTDTVSVTATAAYEDANVNTTAGDDYKRSIVFTNINLTGADAGNYIAPSSIGDLNGKITPFELVVTKINDTIPDAYWKNLTTDTKTTSNYTTAQTAPDTGLEITYTYTYDDTSRVGTVTNGVTISGVDLSPTNTNYTVTYSGGKMNGKVVTQGIASLSITQQPTTEYKYGETLDLINLEVTVTYSEGGGSAYVRYGDDGWNTLGLKIDEASLDHGDSLKIAHTGKKIKVTTSDGSKSVETDPLTVNPRTLYITATPAATVTKQYDGTTAVNQTITLAIADEGSYDGTYYDGLLSADSAYTLSNATPSYTYNDKNVGTGIALKMGETVTLQGTNAGEYELTFQSLTGAITAQSVTLTPVIADIPVNKFATADTTITETGISIGDKLLQSGIVSGEEDNFTFNYTVTVTDTQLGTIDTYTIAPTATSESGTGKDNYSFTWNNASVKVVPNGATSAVFKQEPTLTGYEYGDTVDLTGTKVEVTYNDGSKHEFTYGTQEWTDEGLEVQWSDNSAVSTTQILKTSDNKGIQVKVADGVIAGPTNGINVGKRTLTLTAAAADPTNGIKKTYDTDNTVADSQVSVDSTGKYGNDVVTIGTVTATYDNKNQGTNKTVTVSVTGTSIKDNGGNDVTNQYNIVQPSTLTGTIEPKAITVTGINVPNILTGAPELTVTATTWYSEQPESGVSVTIKATYPNSTQDTGQTETQKTVSFTKTESGNDAGNYTFTLYPDTGTGKVVDNLIYKITVTPPANTEYIHGDTLNLTGMVIAVKYINSVDDNTYTYVSGDNWTDKNSNPVTTGSLPVSFVLVKDGAETAITATQQLRHDKNNGSTLVVKGDGVSSNGISITVNTKVITEIYPGYVPPTTAAPSKTYDGTTKVPDNSFVYYSDDILDDDKSVVEKLLGATAKYAQKDASYEADGTTLKDIPINFSNPTLTYTDDSTIDDNYTFATNATMTYSNVTGTISKATLTITITSVPSITIGGEKAKTLTKDTHYTQNGEVTVNNVKETVDVAVTGTYEQNTTATSNSGSKKVTYTWSIADPTNNNNYTVSLQNADGNVIDNTTVFGPEGTVNKKAVTGIAVTPPSDTSYEHGDNLALDGMTITVSYGTQENPDDKVYTYRKDVGWTLGNDTTTAVTPEDVTIKWKGTATAVTDGAKLRLDDTDKGYATDGNNKKAAISVAPSATDSSVPAATTDITVTPKQLTLTVVGDVSKKYDGTNTLSSLTGITLTLGGVQGSTPDAVSVDTTKLLNNIRYDGTGTNKAGVTTGLPKLVIGTIDITGEASSYYTAPAAANIENKTTGIIEQRPIKVIAITKSMNAAIGASDGTLEGIGSDNYTLSGDNGLYQLVNGEDVKIDVDYAYGNTSTEGSTTVTYSNPKVSTSDNAYASNYAVSFAIDEGTAVISNGTVTGVTLSGPSQTGSYTHGDKFNLAGTEITITYDNNGDSTKTDKYSYDTESGKWTLTRDDGTPEATKVELPRELSLKLGSTPINTNPTSDDDKTIVKYGNNTNTLVATYTKNTTTVNSTPSAAYEVKQKEITINITPPTTDPIEQEYSGKNNKSLNDANLAKLSVEKPTNYAVPNETVSIKEGTFKAEFTSGSVARDQNGDIIAQAINIDNDSFTLDGDDKGNYKLIINNTAKGKVTPKTATITANKVPPIKEGATNLVVDIADYTTDGFVEGDTPTITWKGTYNTSDPNASEIKVNTKTERTLDADTLNNYNVTWSPDSMTGTVTEKVVTEVKVITQPKFSTTEPKHGDKVGENGLDDLEYTVTYSDDSTTKHKKENGEWVTTDGYTAPEDGTTFKWNDTAEDVSKDSVIRKDKANTITIAVEGESAKTAAVTAAAKPVTVKAAGTYTKVYDGTNAVTLNETTPEITYTIEGLVEGDVITVTATPEFADENVAKFGDDYVKAINFTNVTVNGDDDVLANYEIAKTDDVVTVDKTDLKGAITPKEMKITAITVPSKKKGAAVAVSVTNSKAFTTTDIVEKDKDSVTIKYEGAYTSTSAVGENIAVTITDGTLAIDGDDKAMMNYTPKLTGSAAGSVTASSGGNGGGGGAPSNTLTIKDKTEDGKEGEIVKTLTAPAGSAPVDLIGVYKTAPKDPTIIWKSADEKIATVDENGVVSFISEGKTTITATSKTNSSLTAKVEVTVTAPLATPEPTTTPGTVNTPEPTKEPSVITKNMMNPYIVGYDDNVFGPELPISREEVATIFARLIANSIDMDKSYTSQFWDVTENEWSKDYIGYLETFDILHGYDDGSFMPKAYITRAEMAVMMARAEGYDIEGYMDVSELSFPDIPEDYGIWATKAIKYLTDAGVMEGYEDGTFRPTQPITRAETVATVNRVLSDMVVDKIEVLPSDVTDAHWAYDNIVFAMNHRVLKDAAADPNKFVWSEEFDQNIVVKQETVDGDLTDTADGENNSPSESDASAEQTDAPETTASPDAAPEATEMPKEETEPSVSPEPDKEN